MTNDQIDTAIAEFCGWTEIQLYPESGRLWGNRPGSEGQSYRLNAVPQYHRCLNAMHDAEKMLTYGDHCRNTDILEMIVGGPAYKPATYAGAIQRAEALLKTVGLWQEPEKLSTHCAV